MRIRNDLIPGIAGYNIDRDGSDAPWMWYGVDAVDGAVDPWASAPLGSLYIRKTESAFWDYYQKTADNKTGSDWISVLTSSIGNANIIPSADNTYSLGNSSYAWASAYVRNLFELSKLGSNVLWVDPKGAGTYTTLSSALAAITTASDTNEYLIIVNGEVTETTVITAKSHVHVLFMPGASVTINTNSVVNGVNFSGLTNVTWAAIDWTRPHIIRTGTASNTVYGVNVSGSTVNLHGLYIDNRIAGSSGNNFGMNFYNSVGTLTGVYAEGGDGSGGNNYGINISFSSPTMSNCTGTGGGGGTGCSGIYIGSSSSPTMSNCTGTGGSGGSNCYGIVVSSASSPVMISCTGIGGGGGTYCHGIVASSASSPMMISCTGIGGEGGTYCYGIYIGYSSSPMMISCTGTGGGATPKPAVQTISASTRQDDTYTAPTSLAYRVVGAYVDVTAAGATGLTLTLRTASGGLGNALTAAIPVDSTGVKYFTIIGHYIISAGSPFYGRLSASSSTLAYTIRYVYETCSTTCYGIYDDTDNSMNAMNCTFISNAASSAVYVTNNGDDRSVFIGGVASSGKNSATRQPAFVCQSSWNPGQVYNMVLDGGATNLTAATGTANGTNVVI